MRAGSRALDRFLTYAKSKGDVWFAPEGRDRPLRVGQSRRNPGHRPRLAHRNRVARPDGVRRGRSWSSSTRKAWSSRLALLESRGIVRGKSQSLRSRWFSGFSERSQAATSDKLPARMSAMRTCGRSNAPLAAPQMSVVVATAYMEEADRYAW